MPRRKRSKKWIWWLVFLVLIIAVVVIAINIQKSFSNDEKKDAENKNEETTSIEEKKEDTAETATKKEEVPQYSGDNPNAAETLTGVVSYADVVNGELVIRTNIDQFLEEGSCNLNIIKNGANIYSQSVAIAESVTTSTCDGFKIPVSELTTGDLQIEINLTSGDKTGKITGKVRI